MSRLDRLVNRLMRFIMDKPNHLTEHELRILKDMEQSLNANPDNSPSHLAEYEVCKALLRTLPIPSQAFTRHLFQQVFASPDKSARKHLEAQRPSSLAHRTLGRVIPIVSLLIVITWFLLTPLGQGLAQEIVNFFARESDHTLPESKILHTPLPVVPVELQDAGDYLVFDLLSPAFIPGGYTLEGLDVDPGGNFAALIFEGPENTRGVMTPQLTIRQNTYPFSERIGPDTVVVMLQINGIPAEYVEGGWLYIASDGTVGDQAGERIFHWERTMVPQQRIRWRAGDIYLELSFVGSDTAEGFLGVEELVRIAESLE